MWIWVIHRWIKRNDKKTHPEKKSYKAEQQHQITTLIMRIICVIKKSKTITVI